MPQHDIMTQSLGAEGSIQHIVCQENDLTAHSESVTIPDCAWFQLTILCTGSFIIDKDMGSPILTLTIIRVILCQPINSISRKTGLAKCLLF